MLITGLNSKCRQDVNLLIQVNGDLEHGEMSLVPPLPLNISIHSSSFSRMCGMEQNVHSVEQNVHSVEQNISSMRQKVTSHVESPESHVLPES